MAGKGSSVERGYMVLERIKGLIPGLSNESPGSPAKDAWVEQGVHKASSREKAITAFLGANEGQGRTFQAIPESDWNAITLEVKKVEPQITFKYAKPQRVRPKKPKAVAAA